MIERDGYHEVGVLKVHFGLPILFLGGLSACMYLPF